MNHDMPSKELPVLTCQFSHPMTPTVRILKLEGLQMIFQYITKENVNSETRYFL